MKLNCDLCKLCIHEDFGYCGRRDEDTDIWTIEENKVLIRCSKFDVDVERINSKMREINE